MAEEQFAGVTVRIRDVSVSGSRRGSKPNVKIADTPGVESRTMFLERDDAGEWHVSDPG